MQEHINPLISNNQNVPTTGTQEFMQITKFDPQEITQTDIHSLEAQATLWGDDFWSVSELSDTIKSQKIHVWVVKILGEIKCSAFCLETPDTFELLYIFVPTELRRKLIGQKLLQLMMDEAQAGGKRFHLEVRVSNIAARALYEKLGLISLNIRKGYYKDGEDAVIYGHRL